MKLIIPTLALFATVAFSVALPEEEEWFVRRADELDHESLPSIEMIVTIPHFEGLNFTGTAKSVWQQMHALDPEFAGPDPAESGVSQAIVAKDMISKRNMNCNWGAWIASWNNCLEGIWYLQDLGTKGAWCGVGPHPACARVSCSRACGMFLCSKHPVGVNVPCGAIPRTINNIANACANVYGNVKGAFDFTDHFIALGHNNC